MAKKELQRRAVGSIQYIDDTKCRLRVSLPDDEFGNRRQPSKTITYKSVSDAEKQLQVFVKECEKAVQLKKTGAPTTLGALYKEFEKNHMSTLRPNTQDFYKNMWKHLDDKKKTRLADIKPGMIYKMLEGTTKGSRTQKGVYRMLYTMLRKAVEWEYIDRNPCEKVTLADYKAKEKRPYDEDELSVVIQAVGNEDIEFQLIFFFASMLGLRRSEIVALQWGDIDYNEGTIAISRAAGRATGTGTYVGETKTAKSLRKLHLPPDLIAVLKQHRAGQAERQLKLGSRWKREDWIFTQWDGSMMGLNTPTRLWADFIKKNKAADSDFPETTLHALRHTAATLLIKNNVPVSTVSGMLGHAQIGTTLNIYTHYIESAQKQASRTMQRVFNKAKTKTK